MRKFTALAACAAFGFGFTGTASADIGLSTTLMDFGNVVIGQQSAIGFDIENTGTEPLTNFAVFFYGQELWFGSTDCPMTFFCRSELYVIYNICSYTSRNFSQEANYQWRRFNRFIRGSSSVRGTGSEIAAE